VRTLTETVEASTTTIPDVVGRSIGSAQRLLELDGLVGEVLEERVSNEPEGTVLGQSRAAGITVEEGYSLGLFVAGPSSVKVIPNVAGDKVARARRALENEGFEVQIRREVSSRPRDTVISQSLAGGTEARPGRQVTLVVAKSAPPNNVTSEGSCTSGYSPCLPPASDYDCLGGGGDGPAYTGRVTVTGSDPYGLDSDNDGVGCE
jgi:beta-lactam-binding protein with PASTA domain